MQKEKETNTTKLLTVSIISGLLGFLLFVSIPFLPVKQTQSSFNWPQGDTLGNITAPLMSYMAQDIDITIPVADLTNLNPGQTTILSTVPENSQDATLRGLFVRNSGTNIDVIIRNVVPLTITTSELAELPANSVLRITSNHTTTKAWIPDATRADGTTYEGAIDDDIRPMLTGIYSEIRTTPATLDAARNDTLNVHVTVDSRFTSKPSLIKYAAIALAVLSTFIALLSLHRIDKLDARRMGSFLPRGFFKPRWLDAGVGGVLLFWYFFGANTADDGYLRTMGEVSRESEYMANYYRWFGVPEAPFGAPYYELLGLFSEISPTSIIMRLPSLIAGIVIWLVLSREVLPRLGTQINQRKVAHITMAATFLLFWITYNNGTRPEPIIAMLALLAWVSFERAIATQRLLPAAIGTTLAAFAIAAGPTGMMAIAALLVALGALIRIVIRRLPRLGAPSGASRGAVFKAVAAQIAPFLAAGTAVLGSAFADQNIAAVAEAARVRSEIGPSVSWYMEFLRYTTLLEQTVDGSFTRRFSMLMLFFCIAVVAASLLRFRRVPGAAIGPTTRLFLVIIGTLFLMIFTPTKWTHHFGVFAGIGAALTALAAVAASRIAVSSQRNRVLFLGSFLMLFAFSLAGTNGWWYVASFGVPWWDKTIQLKGIEASSVMLIFALIVIVWGAVVGFLSEAKHARAENATETAALDAAEAQRLQRFKGIATAPIAVITGLVVAFSMASMAKGFVAQYPAYSIGKGNLASLTGNQCLLASDVLVETNTNDSFLTVADGSELKDSLTAGTTAGFDPNNIPTKIDPGSDNTGTQTGVSTTSTSDTNTTNSTSDETSNNGVSNATTSTESQDGGVEETTTTTADSGTTGGLATQTGINGSHAKLPFGLDNQRVPVIGSFTEGLQEPAYATTKWYNLPQRNENTPLIVFSAAGPVNHYDMNGVEQYGQELIIEYGRLKTPEELTDTTGSAATEQQNRDAATTTSDQETTPESETAGRSESQDRFLYLGELQPLDIGTQPEWRNMRIPLEQIPAEAEVIRIRAVDTNLTPDQWLAFTPPRAPQMTTLQNYIGNTAPTLLDWSIAFQFPCIQNYAHYAGVAEVAEYRISPDHASRRAHTPVMDYKGGGSYGLIQMTSTAEEVPTYLNHDWQRDWGVLDKLTPHANSIGETPQPAELVLEEHTRSGLWSPGPMKWEQS